MHTRVQVLLGYIVLRMLVNLIRYLFEIDIVFYYGSLE